jgi:ribosomal protein S21
MTRGYRIECAGSSLLAGSSDALRQSLSAIAPLRERGAIISLRQFIAPRFFLFPQQVKSMVNCFIQIEPGESMESIWRRFRKVAQRAGVFNYMQRTQCFVPKAQKRAAKAGRARAKAQKDGRA